MNKLAERVERKNRKENLVLPVVTGERLWKRCGKKERWRPLKNKEDDFWISDHGRLWSVIHGEFRAFHAQKNGYLYYSLNGKKHRVHRLVAETFLKRIDGKNEVNHKNLRKEDNHFSNLEWCNRKENNVHYHKNKHLLLKDTYVDYRSKLTPFQVLEIRRKYKPRKYTAVKLAKEYGITKHGVYGIIARVSWRHL